MLYHSALSKVLLGKKLLIFDFDGTLADTSEIHAKAFYSILQPYNLSVDYCDIAGLKTSDAIQKCFALNNRPFNSIDLDKLVDGKQALARQYIRESLAAMPGVDQFLSWAKSRFQLALASSGSRGTVSLAIEKLGYGGLFSPLVFGDDVTHAKPDPEIFNMALNLSGFSANEALIFEDSEAGFLAAARSNIDCYDARANLWLALDLPGAP